jgi:hypothetical protein
MSSTKHVSFAIAAAVALLSINVAIADEDAAPAAPAAGVAAGTAATAAGVSTGALVVGGTLAAAAVVATGIALAGSSNGNGNSPTTTGPTQTRP